MKETTKEEALESEKTYVHDPHSYANAEDAVVRHLALDLNVDFDKKVIFGKASIFFDNKTSAKKIILDTRDLMIAKVTLDSAETETSYVLAAKDQFLGQALSVEIRPNTKFVTVYYSTSPEAQALQWLNPEQTAGKKFPFLFTQSQAILARSWVPVQDSPGIRFTYEAKVHVPPGLMAVMSARNPQEKSADGNYSFRMDQRIPAYLLALAVGDFTFRSLDKRTGVYAENVTIAKAVNEFAD